ncbi:DEAD/DEAH box helicase [Treponema sp. C6A8]|uniref:DEAD/DEAH box helicase n=1 Tax=Treponema sp. C6A8 TaxID=1410609 RepID=UPI00048736C0|nr:DEAD/DEAH box helicase [Treponema sp. C6A8]
MKIEEMNEAALASDEVVLSSELLADEDDEVIPLQSDEADADIEDDDDDDGEVSFADLGLDEDTLKAVEKKGFKVPSPIQVLAIPRLLNGDTNLIARARTGTGKTAAFGLPIIQSIKEKSDKVQALILEPTRELAIQTCEEMQSFASKSFPRTTVLYGGASYVSQIRELKKGCEIVVGTPGRIKDHLERKTLDLSKIKYFILDEGDEMLDMGFIDDIREIFQQANQDARILLFSATMPAPILKIAADFMGEYDIIEEAKVVEEPLLIDQKYWVVKESEKIEALVRLIDISPDFYGVVFTQTKMDADNVTRQLDMRGYEADALHGDIMQNQREKVLERLKMKKTRILVATDVAARGIDIKDLTHVVNYSLPFDAATYVHRIGRTGRAGKEGVAVTFVRPEERRKLRFLTQAVAKASKGELKEGTIPSVNEVISVKQERLFDELKKQIFTASSQVEEAAAEETTDAQVEGLAERPASIPDVDISNINPNFVSFANELAKDRDPNQVLAAVLSVMYGEKLSPKHYGRISVSKDRDFAPRGDQTRIFISLGKKDGYRAKEIADYFSKLLHIPGRMVDQIDVAQQFSLVSLPIASARKAIELSKSDRSLPHMHVDNKEEGRGSRRGGRDDFGGRGRGDFGGRERRRSEAGAERRAREGSRSSRPNTHSHTERNSPRAASRKGASAFVKSGKKAERF